MREEKINWQGRDKKMAIDVAEAYFLCVLFWLVL